MKFILFFVLIAVEQYAEVTCFVPLNYRNILIKSIGQLEEKINAKTVTVHVELHPLINKIYNSTVIPIKNEAKKSYEYLAAFMNYYKEAILHTLGLKMDIKIENKNETSPLISGTALNYKIQKDETGALLITLKKMTKKQGEQESEDNSFESLENNKNKNVNNSEATFSSVSDEKTVSNESQQRSQQENQQESKANESESEESEIIHCFM